MTSNNNIKVFLTEKGKKYLGELNFEKFQIDDYELFDTSIDYNLNENGNSELFINSEILIKSKTCKLIK